MKLAGAMAATAIGALILGLAPARAEAQDLRALSAADAQFYAAAFDAAERGDNAAADDNLKRVTDPCLVGDVGYVKLTHAAPRKASYGDLVSWLKVFAELPGAQQIYSLAMKMRPDGERPPAPADPLAESASRGDARGTSRAAREAYGAGEAALAMTLAEAQGDDWMAGLAAYRQADFARALAHFGAVAQRPGQSDEDRAAGAFWAARSADSAGQGDRAAAFLRAAANFPATFYGAIAARRLELTADPLGRLLQSSTAQAPAAEAIAIDASGFDAPGVAQLVATDRRARRAVALSQIGRRLEAGAELRAGMALAADQQERWAWTTLAVALNPDRPANVQVAVSPTAPPTATPAYPTPDLAPIGGFTLNKALVYALTLRESRFNALAVSPAGAIGLMQVMPASAASVSGEAWLKSDPIPLFDPATNLRIGQDYVGWLMDNAAGHDLLRAVAAYNGGPAMLQRAQRAAGPDADDLLFIESAPSRETRDYVRKVMAAYWAYRRQFGQASPSLDAAASATGLIDARLDR
ncbi:MAG TPA: lytic transglycosylase domain-containing protein [Caulobacteraceae bacterium]